MSLLEFIINEYLLTIDMLIDTIPIENNRIIIEPKYFKWLLEKYPYLTFKEKTKVYKDLNLIVHDKNNYTMPVKDKTTNKTVRKVVINYNTYLTVKKYYDEKIKQEENIK